MKRNQKLRLSIEALESRQLLTALPAVSFTSTAFEFPGGFAASVLGAELTDVNKDSTGTIRTDRLDYALIREGNVLEFWIHNGDGKHSRAAQERLPARPTLLTSGDLNNDGYDDYLVATNRGIEVYLNQRADIADNRAWRGVVKAGTANSIATSMVLSRINDDGFLDLITTTTDSFEVRPGRGDGTFGPSISYSIGSGLHSVAAGKLNDDGRPDLVVGTQTEGTNKGKATVFLNDGEGIFESGQVIEDFGPTRTIALADMNADSVPELIIGTWESRHLNDPGDENIHIWNGNGDGTFASEPASYETTGSPLDFAVNDLNSDGFEDLVVGHDSTFHHPITNNGPGGVAVLLGTEQGRLLEPVRISTPGGLSVSSVNSQIASFQQSDNTIRHFEWNHELGITGENLSEPVENLYTRRTAVTADFNGDGTLDAAETEPFQADVPITIRLRNAEGQSTERVLELPSGFTASELAAGDLNGDGTDDLAIIGRTSGTIQTAGFLSNGDGTFSDTTRSSARNFQLLEIVDIDGDGRDDWLGVSSGNLVYLKSDQDGSRKTTTLASKTTGDFRDAVVSSRNADGSADLLAISSTGIHSIRSDSEGGYTETSVSQSHHFSTFGDFNDDGHMDVAFGLYTEPQIRTVFGSENGQLSRPFTVAPREGIDSITTFTHEGADILALTNQFEVALYSIDADSMPDAPTFESTTLQTGLPIGSAYMHDLLGDETPDLVMLQGSNLFAASPSTQILVAEAMPDGTFGQPRHAAVPLVEGRVLEAELTEGRIELMLSHQWGVATVEIGPGKPGDFNFNGRIDTSDYHLLCTANREQNEGARKFDLDGDKDVDDSDLDIWLQDIAQTRRGDANFDGRVDFQDFLQMSANFGHGVPGGLFGPGGWEQGDTDCDGEVTFADFLRISANFGFGT